MFPLYLKRLAQHLEDRGTGYFADGKLTVADLKVFLQVRHLRGGNLDHIPADLVDRVAPALVAHFERVNADPRVRAYYDPRDVA